MFAFLPNTRRCLRSDLWVITRANTLAPHLWDDTVRVGTVSDIATPVIFVTSDEASYITGQIFWADGGETSYVPMPRADCAR